MLNGDVLTDMDLTAQLEQHESTGARATIALIPVEDPSRYGLVRLNEDRSVKEFLEKPSSDQIDTDLINAGAYVLERDVLEGLSANTNISIEREVFPDLVGNGLYAYPQEGYWLDIGTPGTYLQATWDILERTVETVVGERLGNGYLEVADDVQADGRIIPPALAGGGCRVASGARVGSQAVLGHGVKIGEDTIVESAVVLNGADVGPGCVLRNCIIGPGARLGANTHVEGGVVLGEGVTIGANNVLKAGARIFPGVELPDSAILF
jgi:mannose-1-phosphate guanylyltransferase